MRKSPDRTDGYQSKRTPIGELAPTRLRDGRSDRQTEQQYMRDVEYQRGARETYYDGTSRAIAIREDEGGYDNG